MAKGSRHRIYCFNRFVALNEVGLTSHFGLMWTHSTAPAPRSNRCGGNVLSLPHDTKRSGCARPAKFALRNPQAWSAAVRRWSRMNEASPGRLPDTMPNTFLPDPRRRVAIAAPSVRWPHGKASRSQATTGASNAAYEQALRLFTATLSDAEFTMDLERFVAPLIEPGQINRWRRRSSAHRAGVPDIYLGWSFGTSASWTRTSTSG